MEEIKIKCVDCGGERIFTVEEQKTFADRRDDFGNAWSLPKRCKECAKIRKDKLNHDRKEKAY